ncbi:hypothetical protein SEENIN0B_03041 [Salmonella enterica subsp. enterica serovar Infantis str. SARB27]|uniref:Uncharacterized protein n=1 Tax=Salmonella enterica subsp. enterica serovar Infantis str. SARB27 TaxID=596155 RepID=A0A6C8GBR7_SALIN|nr:hypothetical protein SEENIN0B_03041 [Salmonella enterica subsp. enterica serovar Infantis str. SARB27]
MFVAGGEDDAGLSPLARGTLVHAIGNFHHARFIPAGAGNTFQACFNSATVAVYPRWRGEHLISMCLI